MTWLSRMKQAASVARNDPERVPQMYRPRVVNVPPFDGGLYLDEPTLLLEPHYARQLEGWQVWQHMLMPSPAFTRFATSLTDKADVLGGSELEKEDGTHQLIILTKNRASKYNSGSGNFEDLICPITAGTVNVSNANPAVVTVASGAPLWQTNLVHVGDKFKVDSVGTYVTIASVDSETQVTLTGTYSGAPHAGVAYTIDRLQTGTTYQLPSFATILDKLVWSNRKDPIRQYSGSGDVSYVTLAYAAAHLEGHGTRLVVANTLETGTPHPTRVRWTALNTLDFAALGSGFVDLADTSDRITSLKSLEQVLFAYKEHNIYVGYLTGNVLAAYDFRIHQRGRGCIAPYSLATDGNQHVFVAEDDIYAFDGASLRSLTRVAQDPRFGRIRREFFNSINYERLNTIVGYIDTVRHEYYLSVPAPGNDKSKHVWVYNFQEDTWRRDRLFYGFFARSFFSFRKDAITTIDQLTGTIDQHTESIDSLSKSTDQHFTLMGIGFEGVSEGTLNAQVHELSLPVGIGTLDIINTPAEFESSLTDLEMPGMWKTVSWIELQYRNASSGVMLTATLLGKDPNGNDVNSGAIAVDIAATSADQVRRAYIKTWLTAELFSLRLSLHRTGSVEIIRARAQIVDRGSVQAVA